MLLHTSIDTAEQLQQKRSPSSMNITLDAAPSTALGSVLAKPDLVEKLIEEHGVSVKQVQELGMVTLDCNRAVPLSLYNLLVSGSPSLQTNIYKARGLDDERLLSPMPFTYVARPFGIQFKSVEVQAIEELRCARLKFQGGKNAHLAS